jgi:hypothetical protein
VGVVKKMRTVGQVSLSAIEDQWQRDATAAAIAGARGVVRTDGPIPPGAPIGRLSDTEWGWAVAAVLFAWISKRAEQAAAEQLDTEQTIRLTALHPEPWDAGAVVAILPELADTPGIDWSKPLTDWPRETLVEFLTTALALIRKAAIARDLSDKGVIRKSSASMIAPSQRCRQRTFDDARRIQRRDCSLTESATCSISTAPSCRSSRSTPRSTTR